MSSNAYAIKLQYIMALEPSDKIFYQTADTSIHCKHFIAYIYRNAKTKTDKTFPKCDTHTNKQTNTVSD